MTAPENPQFSKTERASAEQSETLESLFMDVLHILAHPDFTTQAGERKYSLRKSALFKTLQNEFSQLQLSLDKIKSRLENKTVSEAFTMWYHNITSIFDHLSSVNDLQSFLREYVNIKAKIEKARLFYQALRYKAKWNFDSRMEYESVINFERHHTFIERLISNFETVFLPYSDCNSAAELSIAIKENADSISYATPQGRQKWERFILETVYKDVSEDEKKDYKQVHARILEILLNDVKQGLV